MLDCNVLIPYVLMLYVLMLYVLMIKGTTDIKPERKATWLIVCERVGIGLLVSGQ